MVTVAASGTQAATVGTEHSLHTNTTARVFVFVVDTVNMAAADQLELRIYVMAHSGGTRRLAYYALYTHAQPDPIKISVAVPSAHSIEFTLRQTAGTGRSYAWAVWTV